MDEDRYSTIGKTTTAELEHEAKEEAHRDPITGEPGAHPVGTGIGAVGGAVAGAAVGGAAGGPVGAMVGAAVGGLAGGLAGKGVAEAVNPTEEEAYWRENYRHRPYVANRGYEDLAPAYRYGWESRTRYPENRWEDVQSDLERGWDKAKLNTKLGWHEAKDATRDAWDRVTGRYDNERYWQQNYASRPYYRSGSDYSDYRPAYNYGWDAAHRYRGRRWEDVENDLERGWEKAKYNSKLGWHQAKDAVRDAWHRVERALPGDADRDLR
jgi:hypothetical protein